VGSTSTVRDRLLPQVEEAGINYLLGRLAFGNLAVERSLQSVELLEKEVLPALASIGASRSGQSPARVPAPCETPTRATEPGGETLAFSREDQRAGPMTAGRVGVFALRRESGERQAPCDAGAGASAARALSPAARVGARAA
jgi:hypothetical protein